MIPINIAVTGHRDIVQSKKEIYKNAIKKVLEDYQIKFRHTNIQVLSGLAEGADILAAQAALELGCILIAVLPMKKEKFIQTFNFKEQNKQLFEDVLSKADRVVDLSEIYTSCKNDNESYIQLGAYLTQNAQSVIALWDGINNNSPGGTASVVKIALEGAPRKYKERYCITDRFDTLPVHHIRIERINESEGTVPFYTKIQNDEYMTLYPQIWEGSDADTMISYYENQLIEIDEFNRKAAALSQKNGYLYGSDDNELIQKRGIDKIIEAQKAADDLAGLYQGKTYKLLILQLLFGFFVFFWVSLVDEIVPFAPYILFLSPIFFLLCVFVFKYVNKKSIEERYYSYRAFAECLRIQFYWKSANIRANAYSSYSKKNAFELGWIVQACKNVSLDANYHIRNKTMDARLAEKIKKYWISDQYDYFTKKIKENIKIVNRNKKYTYLLFGAGLLFVILLIIERLVISSFYNSEILMHLLLFLIDASLAGGAIFSGYLDKRQLESEQKQYSRMAMIFSQTIKELDSEILECNDEEIQNTIIELGCDALDENADWVLYNKMNNIDIPLG